MAKTAKAVKVSKPRPNLTTSLAESGLSATAKKNPEKIKRLHVLYYGPPKTAKTVIAHGMPRTRTLDFDNGMQSVEWAIKKGVLKKPMDEIVYATILPPDNEKTGTPVLDQAMEVLDAWIEDEDIPPEEWDKPYPQFWDTLIIDSSSPLTDASITLGLKENSRLKLSNSWSGYGGKVTQVRAMRQQDWGAASFLFQKFINHCRGLGKNIIVIAHEYHNTDDEGNLISIDPLVIGQLRQKLPGSFDEVWYATKEGTRQDPHYLIQTTPDPKRNLGSRLGCLDPVEGADFMKIKQKIAAFYDVDPDWLWSAAHGSEEIQKEQEEGAKENLSPI